METVVLYRPRTKEYLSFHFHILSESESESERVLLPSTFFDTYKEFVLVLLVHITHSLNVILNNISIGINNISICTQYVLN